jgi:hypothetical protein
MESYIDKFSTKFYGEMEVGMYVLELYKNDLPKEKELYIKLSTEVCTQFMKRANYWENKRVASNDEFAYERSKNLWELALKLKQTPFKKRVMREIKYLTSLKGR